MRTLVISDLHLGSRLGRDVLRRPAPLAALGAALDGVGRLVLLGDVVELVERRPDQAMDEAEPVVRALAARLNPGADVIVVPGNHDAELVRPWLRAHGVPEAADAEIPGDATPRLARLVSWLAPATVRVHYPGVWLADGVWATHGHYLDRHLLPGSAYGIARGRLGLAPAGPATPVSYEQAGGPSITRLESWLARTLPRPLAALADDVSELLRAATMPSIPRRLRSHRLAPLAAWLLGRQMQRSAIPALAEVSARLGVDADWLIFGHVHRCGPLAGDDADRWRGPGGRPRILNTGAWVYEPLVVHRAGPTHPYWPGGAVVIEDGGPPRAVRLLDHVDGTALRGRLP